MDTSTPRVGQPDREIKLVCPRCGARARMTSKAIRLSGSIRCDGDGGTFGPMPHRQYTPRRTAAELAAERAELASKRVARLTAELEAAKVAELAVATA